MKKFVAYLTVLAAVTLTEHCYAKSVDVATARTAGYNFLKSENAAAVTQTSDLELAYTAKSKVGGADVVDFFVFNFKGVKGFVMVSGDDNVLPVLAYSTESYFVSENMSPNIAYWLDGYKKQINCVIEKGIRASAEIAKKWNDLTSGSKTMSAAKTTTTSVSPLLSTTWDQEPYYNDKCPYDYTYSERTVTGCVATAMSQVMKYWSWPLTGCGAHSYSDGTYGTLSAGFDTTSYAWSSMPTSVSTTNAAVATLMYHAGVSVDMSYGPDATGGSGSYVTQIESPLVNCAEYALKRYFHYKSSLHGVTRSAGMGASGYTESTWVSMLKTDLNASHPIIYTGSGTDGGHCWVCDGYNTSSQFHFNWGWSGLDNGYYTVDDLAPAALGGADFNTDQSAVLGIVPDSFVTSTSSIKLGTYLTCTASPLTYGQSFSISTKIKNTGSSTFTGDFSAQVYDTSGNLVATMAMLTGKTISAGATSTTYTFSTTGIYAMVPGYYYVRIYSRPTSGSWTQVANNGSYINNTSMDVKHAENASIYLYDTITVSSCALAQGQSFSITIPIANFGASSWSGNFDLSLYNISTGAHALTIKTITGASLGSDYYNNYTFNVSNVNVAPGKYVLMLEDKASSSSSYEITGSSYSKYYSYQNPIVVTVNPPAGTWTGITSTNWATSTNWSCAGMPSATVNAYIPAGTTYSPAISSGSYTVDSLKIDSAASVSLSSGTTLTVKGNMTNAGSVKGAGTLTLGGTAAQVIRSSGVISNLKVNNSSGASIATTGAVKLTGTLTLTSGTFTTNSNLTLASDSNGTARIGTLGSGSISGSVTCQQYIEGGRRAFRSFGHPFTSAIALSQLTTYIDITGSGGTSHGFTSSTVDTPSAFWYNPTVGNTASTPDPGWRAFTSATSTTDTNSWKRFEGIRLLIRGKKGEGMTSASYTPSAVTISFHGSVNTGTIHDTLHKGTHSAYNLLSNPYPSPVDIGIPIYNAKSSGNISGSAYYVWNPYLATSGGFVTKTIDSTSYYLEANASFEVVAAANNKVLTFSESNKGTTPSATLLREFRDNYVSLKIYDNDFNLWDLWDMQVNNNAVEELDDNDATKPANPDMNFYSLSADGEALAIDARPLTDKAIPLGINTDSRQGFVIKADGINLPGGKMFYLHDKYLRKYILLMQGTQYEFIVSDDPGSQGNNRFELTTTDVEEIASTAKLEVIISPNPADNEVSIKYAAPAAGQTSVRITNISGRQVAMLDLGVQQSGTVSIPLNDVSAGLYLATVTCGNETVSQKIIRK